jgi:hypothetical protein
VKTRPIVIFPEGTKTNGRGILHFPEGIFDIILKSAKSNLRVHTLRFDYDFEFASPYNTADISGIKTAVKLLTQFRNVMLIQSYFNLEQRLNSPAPSTKAPTSDEALYDFVRSTMYTRGKNYGLKLTYSSHEEFLRYWFDTQKKGYTGNTSGSGSSTTGKKT